MTRVIIASGADLGSWHSPSAPLSDWLSSFWDIGREMILLSGQSQKTLRRHVASLEAAHKQIASAVIEGFMKLPRSSNPRQRDADFKLSENSAENPHMSAITSLRASEEYRVLLTTRQRGPNRRETAIEAFDRTIGPLLEMSEALTIIDAYAISELAKPNSVAREIFDKRISLLGLPVTVHGLSPRELPNSYSAQVGDRPAFSSLLTLSSHHKEFSRSGRERRFFPHLRLWKFDLSQGAIAIGLDQGFDTFNPKGPGAVTNFEGLDEWKEAMEDVVVTTDHGPNRSQVSGMGRS